MSAQQEYEDGYYRLKSPVHNKVMKAHSDYTVSFEDESEAFDQVWYVKFDKNGLLFKSCYDRYLCSERKVFSKWYSVIADRENGWGWEHWVMEKVDGDIFALKSRWGMYLTVNEKGEPNSDKKFITSWEEFTLEKANTQKSSFAN